MDVQLRPELQKFLDEQVRQGHFASHAEAVEAGVARLMLDPEADDLDEQDVEQIRRSLDQMRRGEVVDARKFAETIGQRPAAK
jgi:Arc/MetJ-type ribon-helix-helix transcriptional regulator